MKKIFLLGTIAAVFAEIFFANFVHAEVKTYEGIGEATVETTMEDAKNSARKYAARDAAEKFSVYVESLTETKNAVTSRDEIVVKSESIMKIIDVKYRVVPFDEDFAVRAIVTAEFDTDEIEKFLHGTGK